MVVTKNAIKNEIIINKISKLLEELSINYNEASSYVLAFIHRSLVNEKPDFSPDHNERLEFLGDAVLELVVTSKLFNDYPEKTEGELTDIRSALVRGTNLAKIARVINLPKHLLLGKGEELGGGRDNDYLLANLLEALIGGIYIDAGPEESKKFILTYIYPTIEDILKYNLTKDYKTIFQEFAQAEYEITPTYNLISESGPDHDKTFEVGIYLSDKLVGTGIGSSKKKAQEKAALDGFNNINK